MAALTQNVTNHGVHSFDDEDKVAFVNHINETLSGDVHLQGIIPICPTDMSLFTAVGNGLLLAKLINKAVPGTIDVRALNLGNPNHFQINENQNLVINSAKAIGCSVVNVGASDLVQGTVHLVLGLIWQIIKIQLTGAINLTSHPELCRLLGEDEDLAALLRLTPEQVLLRWFNYHLKRAGSSRVVSNFSNDIKDSECYTILLTQIDQEKRGCDMSPMQQSDIIRRADVMLNQAEKIQCRKFVTSTDVARGNQHLNLAFTAHMFNTHPALEPLTQEEFQAAGIMDDDEGDSREARAFKMWINSMGLLDVYVNNLYEDLSDGLILLKVLDKVRPGIVHWKGVNNPATSIWKKVENTNYVVLLGKQLNFSMVNIGGKDICDKNRKLLLGLVWQIMRLHIVSFLRSVRSDGREVDENWMIDWCNQRVATCGRECAQLSSAGFRDPTLSSSLLFFNLLATIESRAINWELVTPGVTREDKESNAKYVISVARKLDCCIFLLWEDIVEVKPKMVMTFVGAIMTAAIAKQA